MSYLNWTIEHYWSDWEIERVAILATLAERIEFLRSEATTSWRGSSGPGVAGYDTGGGKIQLWWPWHQSWSNDPPDETWKIEKFVRLTLAYHQLDNDEVQGRLPDL